MTTVITYGTYDLFHVGHLRLLQRLKTLGDRLVVGVSTDDFNALKGKRTYTPFAERMEIVSSLDCVDFVFPEESWDQKVQDIQKYQADIFAMGDDWAGKFDYLSLYAQVCYLPRTPDISTTKIKDDLKLEKYSVISTASVIPHPSSC
jgi:glycerol-3-phosphate cytidylyltransferase